MKPIACLLALLGPVCIFLSSVQAAEPFEYDFRQAPLQRDVWYVSHGWANGEHQSCEWLRSAISHDADRLVITLSDKGGKHRPLGCGEVRTRRTFGYGLYEVHMRATAGSGLNANFFTFTGPVIGGRQHDEIDFEFLGKSPRQVQLNYWVDGEGEHETMIDLGFDASQSFRTYAFDWRPDAIVWYIDGEKVHETKPGAAIPSTPGHIFLSLWSASEMIVDWMGPFRYEEPKAMAVKWVRYTPHNKE